MPVPYKYLADDLSTIGGDDGGGGDGDEPIFVEINLKEQDFVLDWVKPPSEASLPPPSWTRSGRWSDCDDENGRYHSRARMPCLRYILAAPRYLQVIILLSSTVFVFSLVLLVSSAIFDLRSVKVIVTTVTYVNDDNGNNETAGRGQVAFDGLEESSRPSVAAVGPAVVPTSPSPTTILPRSSTAPTNGPTWSSSLTPTPPVTNGPTVVASTSPTKRPRTSAPTTTLSTVPTTTPSADASGTPTEAVSATPTVDESTTPSATLSSTPSHAPSSRRSVFPSATLTSKPSDIATFAPSVDASVAPTTTSSSVPSNAPTARRSFPPSVIASATPSDTATFEPSTDATVAPTTTSSFVPSNAPTLRRSFPPSASLSATPSDTATLAPSTDATVAPTTTSSFVPSNAPTLRRSFPPSATASATPSGTASATPSLALTSRPTFSPIIVATEGPTASPFVVSETTAPTTSPETGPRPPTVFTVTGGSHRRRGFLDELRQTTTTTTDGADSSFLVHLGNFVPADDAGTLLDCETLFSEFVRILAENSPVPVHVSLGDRDTTRCADESSPSNESRPLPQHEALGLWETAFGSLEDYWTTTSSSTTHRVPVTRRAGLFGIVRNDVLFVGLNLLRDDDDDAYRERLRVNVEWIRRQLDAFGETRDAEPLPRALFLFGNERDPDEHSAFFETFLPSLTVTGDDDEKRSVLDNVPVVYLYDGGGGRLFVRHGVAFVNVEGGKVPFLRITVNTETRLQIIFGR